jgi:lipopolysaccharide heptosyltransferase II
VSERVLVRAPNWLGDMIMTLPAVRALRAARPSATITVAAPEGPSSVFRFAPDVHDVLPLSGGRGRLALARLDEDRDTLARGRFDLALLLTNSFSSAWVVRRAGVPERWGYRTDARGWLLTRGVRRPAVSRASRHHADYYLALVRALGLAPRDGSPEPSTPYLAASDEARTRARRLLVVRGWDRQSPLVAVAPGAAFGRAKQYPPDLLFQVIATLVSYGVTCVLLGARDDEPIAREIESAAGRRVRRGLLNLAGATDLEALIGVVDLASALVSNDSGAMHVAAALATPVTAIFGPTDERATSPMGPHTIVNVDVWCRPCLLRECPIDHRCMRRIAPERVADAVLAQIDLASNDGEID